MKKNKLKYLFGSIGLLIVIMIVTKPSTQNFIEYTNTVLEPNSDEKTSIESHLLNRTHAKTRDYLIFCEYKVRYVNYFNTYDMAIDVRYDYKTYYGILGNFIEKD